MVIDYNEVHSELFIKYMECELTEKEETMLNKLDEWLDTELRSKKKK